MWIGVKYGLDQTEGGSDSPWVDRRTVGRWSMGCRSMEAHRLELSLWLGLWS